MQIGAGQNTDLGPLAMSRRQLIGTISGRAIDAKTRAPITGASVILERCDANGCGGVSNWATSDNDGKFAFTSSPTQALLYDDTYIVQVTAWNYEAATTPQFTVAGGNDYSVGDLALQPIAMIGSVSGRLVDAITGKPLSGSADTYASARLLQCDTWGCYKPVAYASPGEDGTFRFESQSPYGDGIPAGTYVVAYGADQYISGQTAQFSVGEGKSHNVGTIKVQPVPLRLLVGPDCGSIPARGGTCKYTLKLVNSQNKSMSLRIWSTVETWNPMAPSSSSFQPQDAQKVRLRPRASQVATFSFDVPKNVAAYTSICTEFYVADDAKGFYFAATNHLYGLCVQKDASGNFKPVKGDDALKLRQRMHGLPEGQRSKH